MELVLTSIEVNLLPSTSMQISIQVYLLPPTCIEVSIEVVVETSVEDRTAK